MNSVFKLTEYNKSLMNKLDVNMKKFKDYYQYELCIKTNKKNICFNYLFLIKDIMIFILLMIYIIFYIKNGKFSLDIDYNEKDVFVFIMNNYILYIFFLIVFTFILVNILLMFHETISLKGYHKFILLVIYFSIYFIYYILFMCKYTYSGFNDSILSGLEFFLLVFLHVTHFIPFI